MKIVFHGRAARPFRPDIEALLNAVHEVHQLPGHLEDPADREHFRTADVIVGGALDGSEAVSPRLQLYQVAGAGYESVRQDALPAGAALCNCHGHERAIAEYVLGALLQHAIPFTKADRDLRAGRWEHGPFKTGLMHAEIGSWTLLILGFGHIGKAIARLAKPLGLRILVANRSPIPTSEMVDGSYALGEVETALAAADAVVNTLPLADSTKGLIGRAQFSAMRDHALLINVGRGAVIDETALYEALKEERIGGAVIDTWYVYPDAEHPTTLPSSLPFHTLGNVLMTPHMSGWTQETIRRRRAEIADNINRLAAGQPLANRIL